MHVEVEGKLTNQTPEVYIAVITVVFWVAPASRQCSCSLLLREANDDYLGMAWHYVNS